MSHSPTTVDTDGENSHQNISRHVGSIDWNKKTGCWELHVSGKSGLCVNDQRYTDDSPPIPLKSRDVISTGVLPSDSFFQFLLPINFQPIQVSKKKPPQIAIPVSEPATRQVTLTPTPPRTPSYIGQQRNETTIPPLTF